MKEIFLVMKRFQSPKDYFGIWPSPPMWMLIGSGIQRGILISWVARSLADWSNKYYLIIYFMIFFSIRNVATHVATSWPIAWATLCIGRNFLPLSLQLLLILLKSLLCIVQEPPIGVSGVLFCGQAKIMLILLVPRSPVACSR